MENLKEKTPTELLKIGNDVKAMHDKLKLEIINDTIIVDELSKKINDKLIQLNKLEENYVLVVEEINNRE